MKAIILAAGVGSRLLYLTKHTPKCMIHIKGKPILEHQLDIYKNLQINDINVVRGFAKEQIAAYPGIKFYDNDDYKDNNILASLFYAEKELDNDVIVSYGDTIFEQKNVEKLLPTPPGDITILVELDWKKTYEKKKVNSHKDAEKVVFHGDKLLKIGKHVPSEEANGEFIGIARFTKRGAELLKQTFNELRPTHWDKPFQQASSLRKAYLTDIFQELVNRGHEVNIIPIQGGWLEIDTIEDLKLAGEEIIPKKIAPEVKRALLKKLLAEKGFIRAIESHNSISAIIASNAIHGPEKNSFDAIWISSLTESAAKGHPDIELLGIDSRLHTISEIVEATDKPLIIDGDTGGDPNAFEYFVRKAENLGASAVIIEDKTYPKRNSLDDDSSHSLEDQKIFAHKIKRGKNAHLSKDFMIIARLESLIAGKGMEDALQRAEEYLKAGADGIMIHSKSKSPDEILHFAQEYQKLSKKLGIEKPLVCVPTTYNTIRESELRAAGYHIVIHANHLLRASIKAMQNVCKTILQHERSYDAEEYCCSVEEIFDLVGFSDIKNKEKNFANHNK